MSMGRAKIPIRWISKDGSRQVTFLKRKKGLKKKVEELSILCQVEACIICFGPSDSHPDVWPRMSEACHVIERYKSLPREEQDKKKLDNSSFLEQQIIKQKIELKKKMEKNRELEMGIVYPSWDPRLDHFSINQLNEVVDYVDSRLTEAYHRIEFLNAQQHAINPALQAAYHHWLGASAPPFLDADLKVDQI